MKKEYKDLKHVFPNGATSITFSRLNASDTLPCKIGSTMPYEQFPVDPSDYRTEEHNCPTDMVATGILLDADYETTTLICSPVYHEEQLDNKKCKHLRFPYVAQPKADWDLVFPYEARGYCPNGYMLTGVDYFFDKPYVNIRCCARKDIGQIIGKGEKIIKVLLTVLVVLGILFISFRFYYKKS
jgi:hypothetical protein